MKESHPLRTWLNQSDPAVLAHQYKWDYRQPTSRSHINQIQSLGDELGQGKTIGQVFTQQIAKASRTSEIHSLVPYQELLHVDCNQVRNIRGNRKRPLGGKFENA
jgi:hypothetical protein